MTTRACDDRLPPPMDRIDRITLELQRDAEPIAGWVASGEALRRPFVGWTELFAALTAAVSAGRSDANAPAVRREEEPHD